MHSAFGECGTKQSHSFRTYTVKREEFTLAELRHLLHCGDAAREECTVSWSADGWEVTDLLRYVASAHERNCQ